KTLAVCDRDPLTNSRDIWLIDLTNGKPSRFTFDAADDVNPIWSPDGSPIAFASDRGQRKRRDLFIRSSTGDGKEKSFLSSDISKSPESWSPDDKFLLLTPLQRSRFGQSLSRNRTKRRS